jgi:hypothetical protein
MKRKDVAFRGCFLQPFECLFRFTQPDEETGKADRRDVVASLDGFLQLFESLLGDRAHRFVKSIFGLTIAKKYRAFAIAGKLTRFYPGGDRFVVHIFLLEDVTKRFVLIERRTITVAPGSEQLSNFHTLVDIVYIQRKHYEVQVRGKAFAAVIVVLASVSAIVLGLAFGMHKSGAAPAVQRQTKFGTTGQSRRLSRRER